MRGFLLTTLLLAGLWAEPALALKGQPKLGPAAVPITQQTASVRTAPATDDGTLSPVLSSPRLARSRRTLEEPPRSRASCLMPEPPAHR
jgi:hypothetical protein